MSLPLLSADFRGCCIFQFLRILDDHDGDDIAVLILGQFRGLNVQVGLG